MKNPTTKIIWNIFLSIHIIGFAGGWGVWLKEGRPFGAEQFIEISWHILALVALFTFVTGIRTFKSSFWKFFIPVEVMYFLVMLFAIITTVPTSELRNTPNEVWFIMLPLWALLISPMLYSHYALGFKGMVLGGKYNV